MTIALKDKVCIELQNFIGQHMGDLVYVCEQGPGLDVSHGIGSIENNGILFKFCPFCGGKFISEWDVTRQEFVWWEEPRKV